MSKRRIIKGIEYAVLVCGVLLIAMPLFLVLITAFKSNLQIADNWFSLPIPLYLDNFKTLFGKPELGFAFGNSVIIAAVFLSISTLMLPDHGLRCFQNNASEPVYALFLLFFDHWTVCAVSGQNDSINHDHQ